VCLGCESWMKADFSFRTFCFLLIVAIAAHNFEEWLTFPHFGGSMSLFGSWLGMPLQPTKSWPVRQMALIVATILPASLLLWAGTGKHFRAKAWIACFIAAIFLANVAVPHVPQSLLKGGYTPGLVTALLVNLPLCGAMLFRARSARWLTKGELGFAVMAGILLLPVGIAIAYALGEVVVGI